MINASDISASYRKKRILEHIDLHCGEGEFHALFGPDGSGKTTLLNIIMGLITQYQGKSEILGKNANKFVASDRKQVRYVPYDIIWENKMTARSYFKFCQKRNHSYDISLQDELCEKFSIPVQRQLLRMKRQENKLAQIIAAICAHPKLLILDEPRHYLETSVYRILMEYLQSLNQSGMTILTAVEFHEDIRDYCSHYTYLKEGKVIVSQKASTKEARDNVVTVCDGDIEYLEKQMKQKIGSHNQWHSYLYSGNKEELPKMIEQSGAKDWRVEELTLEEQIDQNYSRWE